MKTGIFLSYKGLGANLLHLSYCHEIAKKFGGGGHKKAGGFTLKGKMMFYTKRKMT